MRGIGILALAAAAVFGLACGAAVAAGPPSGWSWLLGDVGSASIGQLVGGDDVFVGAYYGGQVPVDLSGRTVTDTDVHDGYYEFEHSAASGNTVFLGRAQAGGATSMTFGRDDGQDLTPLMVSGQAGMTDDLQTWQLGSAMPSAIDSQGRLRLNGMVLEPTVNHGKVELQAVLPDGSVQLLVPAGAGSS
jgi:hypothetical protein